MAGTVITRFAPSPTGFLHIGGVRTALFNWLYARHFGGVMRLRIEDTDRARSTEAATAAILDGLRWIGLDWDGDAVYQSRNAPRHHAEAHRLVCEGKAYRCYCTREEIEAMRDQARRENRPPRYDGRCRDRDPGVPVDRDDYVIRLKMPQSGALDIDDFVQGRVRFSYSALDDLIILRSDGSPTYMLSVVVDDHDMGVTHIIRGDDHLTNAARQYALYEALGYAFPACGHIPLIHGCDGKKLSKRHGALGLESYRALGYLPEALRNYLVRLGWSHGDTEIVSTDEMIDWFDGTALGRGAARFDTDKLTHLNAHYMRIREDGDLLSFFRSVLPFLDLDDKGLFAPVAAGDFSRILPAMDLLKPRSSTLIDFARNARFLLCDPPFSFDDKASRCLSDSGSRSLLRKLLPQMQASVWDKDVLEHMIRDFAAGEEIGLGKIAQPLRAALTGTLSSPGIFDVLALLGKTRSIERIMFATEVCDDSRG